MEIAAIAPIENCSSCGAPFGALPPKNGLRVILTRCHCCEQRHYVSVPTASEVGYVTCNEASEGFNPTRHLSRQHSSVINELLASEHELLEESERRQLPRFKAGYPLVVVPVDGEFRPTASAFDATCIDISASGISFAVKSSCGASFWMVDFGPTLATSVQVLMQIVRMEPLGGEHWKVAGPFVTASEAASWST